ncbi:hypothetical protein D920_01224 [Enterococcus faecalis 13-SD-W-01]|nr:hypothetical protein D920_01224 [Enterococcus faecalis 13-SD-W-01]
MCCFTFDSIICGFLKNNVLKSIHFLFLFFGVFLINQFAWCKRRYKLYFPKLSSKYKEASADMKFIENFLFKRKKGK